MFSSNSLPEISILYILYNRMSNSSSNKAEEPQCRPKSRQNVSGGFLLKSNRQTEAWREPAESCGQRSRLGYQTELVGAAGSLHPTQTLFNEQTQWGTAAPLTHYHYITLTTHTMRAEAETYGPEWRRSLACDLCSTPARCRRPRRASRAGGGASGWWCRREEGRQGGSLCSRDKERPHVTVNMSGVYTDRLRD